MYKHKLVLPCPRLYFKLSITHTTKSHFDPSTRHALGQIDTIDRPATTSHAHPLPAPVVAVAQPTPDGNIRRALAHRPRDVAHPQVEDGDAVWRREGLVPAVKGLVDHDAGPGRPAAVDEDVAKGDAIDGARPARVALHLDGGHPGLFDGGVRHGDVGDGGCGPAGRADGDAVAVGAEAVGECNVLLGRVCGVSLLVVNDVMGVC